MRLHSRLTDTVLQIKVTEMDHALGLGKMPEIAAGVCRDCPHKLDSVLWIPNREARHPAGAAPESSR